MPGTLCSVAVIIIMWIPPGGIRFSRSRRVKKNLDYISYDYMCCDDEELLRTHIPDADLKLPECTKMDCNYYVVNGMYYDHYDSGEAMAVMNNMISKKGSPVVFKFSN